MPLMLAVTAVSLAGCVGAFDPETDAASSIAPRVQALVDANRGYPRWEDFPKSTTEIPADAELARRVGTLTTQGGELGAEVERLEWTLGDVAAFEREVNSRIDSTMVSPTTARTAAEVEAFAESLRRRAKAPPPVGRQ